MEITELPKSWLLSILFLGCISLGFSQKITYQFIDSTTLGFKPSEQTYLKAKKVYIAPLVEADSIFGTELSAKLDLNYYTIVATRNEADLVLIYNTSFGSEVNQNPQIPTVASEKRKVPTSKETFRDHNFDSKKTAYQNSKSKYTKNAVNSGSKSSITTKPYLYKGSVPIITKIDLYDAIGQKVDESTVTEDFVLEGYSTISVNVARKDAELAFEKNKKSLINEHLEVAMGVFNNKYFFTKVVVPVFAITVKNKQFDDWNNAVSALNSWINTPNKTFEDPRIPIMESVFEEQAIRDYGQFKDSALFSSAALHNLAVFQYYMNQPTNAGSTLIKAQSNLVYTDKSQRQFYQNFIISLFRGI